MRSVFDIVDPDAAAAFLDELIDDMADAEMPIEVRSLASTSGPLAQPDPRLAPRPRLEQGNRGSTT